MHHSLGFAVSSDREVRMASSLTDQPARPLLPHVPLYQRGPLMNRFLAPVREKGIRNPAIIIKAVLATLRHDIHERREWKADDPLRAVFFAIVGHPSEALALAAEAVAHESMSPEEKEERKAARAEEGRRQYMATMPPTLKQLAYLKNIGVATAPAHRWDASQLIDARVRKGGGHAR
jgi:hypothetical protein